MSLVIEENNSIEIVNVNAENIMQEVIEASSEKAVIVQFWAPWCGPCKQLAPVLEKVCAKFKNIKLTKINIDENQEIAAQMRVQSVPTVFGFLNGQPVDGFAGAQPESAVTPFVEKLSEAAPGQADISGLLQSGTIALGENEPEKAMQAFQKALSLSPESPEAIAGFIRCLIALGEHEEAKAGDLLGGGPFKAFLAALQSLQQEFPEGESPIRTALVTARGAPAHERVIRTLREWDIRLDESLFLGGMDKTDFLRSFAADIFFDDHELHCDRAADHIPTGHVPHGVANKK